LGTPAAAYNGCASSSAAISSKRADITSSGTSWASTRARCAIARSSTAVAAGGLTDIAGERTSPRQVARMIKLRREMASRSGRRRGRLRRCGRGGSGRLLPLQRIGLRLPLGCDLPQAALQLVADRQITGKRPSVLRLRSKLRRGLGRRWFFRHGGGTHSQAEELHLRPSQTNLDRIGHDGRREQEKVRTRPAWQI
jgi:hypothetical protein